MKPLLLEIIDLWLGGDVPDRKNEAFRGKSFILKKLQSPRGLWLRMQVIGLRFRNGNPGWAMGLWAGPETRSG
ncbi:MAG TPA: hypothetical protein VGD88_07485 [Opitutaceae bacterium]